MLSADLLQDCLLLIKFLVDLLLEVRDVFLDSLVQDLRENSVSEFPVAAVLQLLSEDDFELQLFVLFRS